MSKSSILKGKSGVEAELWLCEVGFDGWASGTESEAWDRGSCSFESGAAGGGDFN